ncbi:putative colanic acid biosynthesis acetyltransferase [Rhodococcus ruber]|nr:DapH/DapD/GlmU-related protein [Rhodococcus ruber]QDC15937.1 putative colanic acid biosynthesis acetyltransferase [Rhodococcus ruber]
MNTRWDLSRFSGEGYDKGRNSLFQILWIALSGSVVTRWWCPNSLRIAVLRLFGARIGENVLIRHRVRIHWPWKLEVGDNSWIGEGSWILNLEPVTIGSNVCISQDVLLCTGSHNRRSPTFEFDNGSITVRDQCWIATRATVLRGVTVGENSTIGACALIVRDVSPESTIVSNSGHQSTG